MLGVCAATFCLRRQSRGRLLIVARVRERVCHVHRARCSSSASRRYTSGRPSMEESQKPHPFLREPLLYILNLPAYVSDTALAQAFEACVPFRPHIARDGADGPVSGSIEFKELEKGELFCPSLARIRRYVFVFAINSDAPSAQACQPSSSLVALTAQNITSLILVLRGR